MRYVYSVIKIILFVVVLTFAIKNTDTVTVRYYLASEWQAPLILVLLVFFSAGAAFGVLSMVGSLFRQRREIAALRKELAARTPLPPAQPTPGEG